MADIVSLKVSARTDTGSRAAKKLRKTGLVPGIVYGHKETPVQIAVNAKELDHAIRVQHARSLEIHLDGKKETVLIRELQWDYLGSEMVHIDFLRVSATERRKVTVPIELRGIPKTTGGGALEQPLHTLHVECAVTAIPEFIRVDITALLLGAPIHVSDLKLPEGVTVLDPPESVVVQLKLPGQEEEAPIGGEAEPEVLTAKKPKEGEEDKK